ncbi:MAG: sulfatase-like hydrolase/transferase [Flavobacteriales bacterium]|nr:sulfatase-like hydrolase/transferase [Flavobacteriales bacterium]
MFRGPLSVLALRLGAVALVYSATRFLFVALNADLFPAAPWASYVGGLRFDASAIAWTNVAWIILYLIHPHPENKWARGAQTFLFIVPNSLALFFQFVDLEYYNFSLKRSTADFLRILTAGDDTASLAPAFIKDYWYILLLFLVSIAFLAFTFSYTSRTFRPVTARPWRIAWRTIAVVGLAIASRGGVQLIPLQPLDAARYGGAASLPVTLNTPFTVITSLGKPTLLEVRYMEQSEAEQLWPVHHHFTDSFNIATRPNVVVIILESFSAAYSGRLAGGEGYMPFLDSLMGQSLNMTRAYANGRRSIDGIPAILASIPELMNEAFITSPYASQPFTSLANTLGNEGYSTSFYHGGRNGTMGFDGFTRSAGFAKYIGLNEYSGDQQDHDGHWGVRDRPFLQFFAKELSRERQPFMSAVFTLSSHHPYELPPNEMDRFQGGTQRIHPTLRYADDALRGFFATARQQAWYGNTLFVITADHTADIDRNGQNYNKATDYWVPLLYYMPGRILPMQQPRVTQHIDILPTVLDLLGYPSPFFSFGHSSLAVFSPPYAVMSSNGIYQCVGDQWHLHFDGNSVVGFDPLTADSLLFPGHSPAFVQRDMTMRLQAAIQQFNGHMVRGELTQR